MRKYFFIVILTLLIISGCFLDPSAQNNKQLSNEFNNLKENIIEENMASQKKIVWSKTFGGENDDFLRFLFQTADGDYLLVGETTSFSKGKADIWIIKLDRMGNKRWDKTFGGADDDWVNVLIQAQDGGYLIAGKTYSFGAGEGDAWIIKLDGEGNIIWERVFGGSYNDSAYLLVQTNDGGYAVGGYTFSFSLGRADFWLIKLDSEGNKIWEKTFGGDGEDSLRSLIECDDGGFILSGITYSFGAGEGDFWILKLDDE